MVGCRVHVPCPAYRGRANRGRVSSARSQSRGSRYPAAARCQALCQRFPPFISWHARGRGNARVTGGQRVVGQGPKPERHTREPASSRDSLFLFSPSEAISNTRPSPTSSPNGKNSCYPPWPISYSAASFATSFRYICRRKEVLFWAFFPYLFPASLFCTILPPPLYFLCPRNLVFRAFVPYMEL